ncbi:MAG: PIG-L deacetylase family protein [Chloroflexota bacterium]
MLKTVVAFAPHPDDAEFFAGGLLAKLAREGNTVIVVVATDGSRGSFELTSAALIQNRAEEMQRAARVLGAKDPILLGYGDFELDQLPAGVLRERFIRIIRQLQPAIVVSEDPYSLDEPHPDHRQVAGAAYEAVNFSQLPLVYAEHLQEGLTPHPVVEKYFYRQDLAGVNKIVDITDTIDVKLAALAEHRSQVKFLVEGVFQQARLAGLDLAALLGEAAQKPELAFEMALRQQAAEVGQRAGFAYGEAYRYERFSPVVEQILALAGNSG